MDFSQNQRPRHRRNFLAGILLGLGTVAFLDEVIFHQLLGWHHFYDLSSSDIGLVSDGLFHAFSWFATVASMLMVVRLVREGHLWRLAFAAGWLTGAATNMTGLLPRPLQLQTFGATVVLVEVDDPSTVDMPAMMYLKFVDGRLGFGGIVMSPLRYPDGRWYIKVSGNSLLGNPLATADEIAAWVRTGGRGEDIDDTLALLAELMPGQQFGSAHTRPCLVCETPSGLPVIDRVDDRTVVAIEGERGAMAADEIGRLTADLTIAGRWNDGLPQEIFRAQW